MAEYSDHNKTMAFAGYLAVAGAISMLVGAAFWGASGTDLWQALATGQMEAHLAQLPSAKFLLIVNTCFWVTGVLLLGSAGTLMADFCTSNARLAHLAVVFLNTAVPLAIISFLIMLSLAIHPPDVESANTFGWIGTRADDLATILIIGASPTILAIAGRADWVPGWLVIWAYLTGIAGLLGIASILTGNVALGFPIIPIGMGWMLAAGTVLIRKK